MGSFWDQFWDHVYNFLNKNHENHQTQVFLVVFCLVAVLFNLARDGDGDGDGDGERGDHFGTILGRLYISLV